MSLRGLILLAMGAVAVIGSAQTPSPDASASPPTVTGSQAFDLIRLEGSLPQVPLRNPGVVPNSETVTLDGRPLQRGKDYALDYPSGQLILMVPFREGTYVRVTYRHDPTLVNHGAAVGPNLQFQFQGGSSLRMGLGMVERGNDGSLMRTNQVTMRNRFAFNGSSRMSGLLAYSQRDRVESRSMLDRGRDGGAESSAGLAVLQSLESRVGGGSVRLSFQSIDRGFTNSAAFADAGYKPNEIGQLEREKGLSRVGLGLQDIEAGGLRFGTSFDSVGERGSSIRSQSLSVQGNGTRLEWQGRSVDRGFRRFRDLREDDRQLLEREAGLSTNRLTLDFKQNAANLQAMGWRVADERGASVQREQLALEVGGAKVRMHRQRVDQGFQQFQGIREGDVGQLARERGTDRSSFGLEWGDKRTRFSLADSTFSGINGRFASSDLRISGSNFGFERVARSLSGEFDGPSRMSEGEQDAQVAAIASMFGPDVKGRPEDRGWFARTPGVARTLTRFTLSPSRGLSFRFDNLQYTGRTDGLTVTSWMLESGKTSLTYRNQRTGDGFAEIRGLMPLERERLGGRPGMGSTDLRFRTEQGKAIFFASYMTANLGSEGGGRTQISVRRPGLDLSLTERRVSAGFSPVGELIDPERELLAQMVGHHQRQLMLNWVMRRDLTMRLDIATARQSALDLGSERLDAFLEFKPNPRTALSFHRISNRTEGLDSLLSSHTVSRTSVSHQLTPTAALVVERETNAFQGTEIDAPGSTRHTVRVETRVAENTALKSEQSRTQFENGEQVTVSANTLSTGITKDVGLSVTDVRVAGSGPRPSQRRRNYGFWVNLPGGMRFTYGYAREVGTGRVGTLNASSSLTGGTFGNFKTSGINYGHQRWDDQRYRSTGALQLETVRPFTFGPLRDTTIRLQTDTLRDNNLWQREDQRAALGAKLGPATVGFDYVSQIHSSGRRAVDRTFRVVAGQEAKSRLAVDVSLKLRTMPWDEQFMVRNVSLVGRFIPGVEIIHQTQTHPEVPRGDALLGSVLQPVRVTSWRLNQTAKETNTRFGFSWEERINDQSRQMTRLAGLNATLFANSPSPLRLSYGLEETDLAGRRRTQHRYAVEFNQRPGPNQFLAFSFGNVSWQGERDAQVRRDNWSLRLDYQLRF